MLGPSSIAVSDSPSGQVVRRKLDLHPIARAGCGCSSCASSRRSWRGRRGRLHRAQCETSCSAEPRRSLPLVRSSPLWLLTCLLHRFMETALYERGWTTENNMEHSTARLAPHGLHGSKPAPTSAG